MSNELQRSSSSELAITNKESFSQRFDPVSMTREFKGLATITDAIQADNNSLAFYRKQFSEDTVLAVIETHLLALNISLNTHEKLSEIQCGEIAKKIIKKYYFISIVEVHYVFEKAKCGDYGKIDYAINQPSILLWFESYANEREQLFVTSQIDDQAQHKSYVERSAHREEIERHNRVMDLTEKDRTGDYSNKDIKPKND